MVILEKDIFTFVFYPEYLSAEKTEYILNYRGKYKNELNLLSNIRDSLKDNVSDDIIDRIKIRISERKTDFIEFKKIDYQESLLDYPVIAADSPKLERELRTDTYCDSASSFLIKILTNKDENRIYVFSNNQSDIEEYKLNIEPSGESFEISKNKPLIISPKQDITGVSISE